MEPLPCKLRWSQLLGVLLPVRQQDGALLQMLMTAEGGQGTLWVPLGSFPADPVTSGGKTTKAPGALETKCDSFLLGKTRLVKVCGDYGLGVGRRGRKQRIPASAAHQPWEAGLQCPSDCLPDWHVCMYVCVHICTHVCTCMWAHTRMHARARVHKCTHVCMHMCTRVDISVHTCVCTCARCMCTCPCAHMYAYACTRACVYTCMSMCAYMYAYARTHLCMHVHGCVCMCTYLCTCVCAHAHMYLHLCRCACVYTCACMYKCVRVRVCTHTPSCFTVGTAVVLSGNFTT